MLEVRQNHCFYLFNWDEPYEEQSRFFSPEFWREQDRILGSAQGRGTTWFLRTADLFGMNAALRHYYRGGFWGKINNDRYTFTSLERTRSFAELRLLQRLHQAGLPVPKPLAAKVEKLPLGGYRADILTEKIENAQDLTALLQTQTLSDDAWRQIGGLIRRLHDLQICHTDLNAHNILVQQSEAQEKYWLLDFDKCGQKSGDFWKAQNLARLKRSFLKETSRMGIRFTEENWAMLRQGYGVKSLQA
ncbi:3-deoxy-D-manno-octulosonic acid kinase [Bisgaard Taxon 10/6]|uniref:3-deoxy-D-manno-octulosonic acid kinase n=1 Tax=Exercitatus varius TaxID=67857 RepID=UPI00294AD343|nr:3-deoxy-D-manno-octulosonic acid kinase [Exercitatus varius]MDG2959367.1 3-deoxy-D-manno-octulosonic acid kinase [Exercitatus varius]